MNKLLNKLGISVTYKNGVLEIIFPRKWMCSNFLNKEPNYIYPINKGK